MIKLFLRSAVILVLALAVAGVAWGQSGIRVMSSGGMRYLANSQGMTLYYFEKDVSGKSACAGPCAQYWPPFHASDLSVPAGLQASDFATITRANGSLQTTYNGWPLYTFSGDTHPGDMNGQGFKGVWFIASDPFYTVAEAVSSAAGGKYLVDANGKTLYYFTKDSADTSVCNGGCAKLWPPFDASNISVPSGLNASNFTVITRSDGSQQIAYKGHPLYYFIRDQNRGQLTGQGFRNIWFVVDPAKLALAKATGLGGSSTPAVASRSSSSGW